MNLQDNELFCRSIDAHSLVGQLLTESVGSAMPQALAFANRLCMILQAEHLQGRDLLDTGLIWSEALSWSRRKETGYHCSRRLLQYGR